MIMKTTIEQLPILFISLFSLLLFALSVLYSVAYALA